MSVALLVTACGSGGSPKSAGSAPPPQAPSAAWMGRDKVGKAITLLNKGDAPAARKILADVVRRQPNDPVATSLLKQIDTDPKALLGAESFAYVTRADDSFSALAQRFLGNPTLFYALARYNGIVVPDSLAKGTSLRIPGHEKRETPVERRTEPVRPPASEQPAVARPSPATADPRRAAQLRGAGLEQMNRGAINKAVLLLQQASKLDPANSLIRKDLDRALRIRKTVNGR